MYWSYYDQYTWRASMLANHDDLSVHMHNNNFRYLASKPPLSSRPSSTCSGKPAYARRYFHIIFTMIIPNRFAKLSYSFSIAIIKLIINSFVRLSNYFFKFMESLGTFERWATREWELSRIISPPHSRKLFNNNVQREATCGRGANNRKKHQNH